MTLSLRAAWQLPDGEIVAEPCTDAAPVAQLAVSDTGIGIPTTEQGKMFTRFFRASTAQKNAVPGVGLGLAITKAITTAHGGTLDLRQRRGRGHDVHAHPAAVTSVVLRTTPRHGASDARGRAVPGAR